VATGEKLERTGEKVNENFGVRRLAAALLEIAAFNTKAAPKRRTPKVRVVVVEE
jgi:hypothetical protein